MRLVILGDMHLGARNSNLVIQRFQNEFYQNVFFPYLKQSGIKTVLQLGDFLDNRKWLNVQTLYNIKENFIKPIQELEVDFHTFLGNHDVPLRSSLDYASVEYLLNHEKHFKVYNKPTTIKFNDLDISMMPWICKENRDESMEFLSKPNADLLLGHFEIYNAIMMPGARCQAGLEVDLFKGWKQVISGHFHTPNKIGNVNYIGTPYQLTWSDYNSKRGFWVFDTDTQKLEEFIENPHTIFHKVFYSDDIDLRKVNFKHLEGTYAKLQVKEKKNFEKFEKYLDKVNLAQPFELKVIESFEEYNADNVADALTLNNTEELLAEYVDEVQTDSIDKEAIKKLMVDIFNEAKDLDL